MNTANLQLRKQDQVAWIQIDRPTKLNAINKEVLGELHQVFFDLQQDNSIRVIVLTGSGKKAFVAGADIAEFSEFTPSQGKELSQSGQDNVFTFIEQMNKPVIAAINGFALGGGLELALSCQIRIASTNAQMGLP
ncbi:MAG: enoyl-CoA hydratase/isomerase family protein, partial [Flavobacteriaceae bacterium]